MSSDQAKGDDFVFIRGTKCFVHRWEPKNDPKALVVLYHGFGAHGAYPTVRYAADFLSEEGYAVVAIDFPGHGKSEGLRGYLKSSYDLIEDGIAMAHHARSLYNSDSLPLVLCGSSMGGAIALSVAHRLGESSEHPMVILLAPMLKLGVSWIERSALKCLAVVAPTARLIPSSGESNASKQYRDEKKRIECETDPFNSAPGTNLRVASALTCVDTALGVTQVFDSFVHPYLLLIADEDVVVNNEGSEDLYSRSASKDKTKKNYPALHGLLCEPSPLFDEIRRDILEWLETRISKA